MGLALRCAVLAHALDFEGLLGFALLWQFALFGRVWVLFCRHVFGVQWYAPRFFFFCLFSDLLTVEQHCHSCIIRNYCSPPSQSLPSSGSSVYSASICLSTLLLFCGLVLICASLYDTLQNSIYCMHTYNTVTSSSFPVCVTDRYHRPE